MHMQKVLRKMFPDSTIIAIAHRLRTILDYDRVLVMEKGRVVEYVFLFPPISLTFPFCLRGPRRKGC